METTVETALPIVEDILLFIRRKNRLSAEEWEDFRSWSWLKLVESDYAAIRKYDGRGTPRAYLAVVLSRLLLDYRAQKWGKWRPSARATSLGRVATELEFLIQKKGYTVSEAVQAVATRSGENSEQELYDLVSQLPYRRKNWTSAEDWLDQLPCPRPTPERELVSRESEATRARVESALERSLARLSTEDRVALKMRFEQGLKLNELAKALGYEPKRFYRRFERILGRVRRLLKQDGVDAKVLKIAFPTSVWSEFADSSRP